MINHFKDFNIFFVPRVGNIKTYTLANVYSRMLPLENCFSIEIFYKPYIPSTVTNLRVFNDEQHILHFMVNVYVFKDISIEEDTHE